MFNKRPTKWQTVLGIVIAIAFVIGLTSACSSSSSTPKQTADRSKNSQKDNASFVSPVIKNHVDYHNFYNAQELYDDPATIQWCTFTWGNANSPIVTVPIQGKLTSSTVSLNPTTQSQNYGGDNTDTYYPELPSSDGMYHGNPPPYRYGFTPGGQYVDFTNLATFCTTQLTEFTRQNTKVQVEGVPIKSDISQATVDQAQKQAQTALKQCYANYSPSDATKTKVACPAAAQALAGALGS